MKTSRSYSPLMEDGSGFMAAVDLGSNSFHMVIARVSNGTVKIVEKKREIIRLAAGLDEDGGLDPHIGDKALRAMERFKKALHPLPPERVRVVGTNAMRKTGAAGDFLARAETAVGRKIEIISGAEEARLIHLAVSHAVDVQDENFFIADVGGGSTELIVGKRFVPREIESLEMGSVAFTRLFFQDGWITEKRFSHAYREARTLLEPLCARFHRSAWHTAVGSSGTMKAVLKAAQGLGLHADAVTPSIIDHLREEILKTEHITGFRINGVGARRLEVLPAGLCIVSALFDVFEIDRLNVVKVGIREGIFYDMMNRERKAASGR